MGNLVRCCSALHVSSAYTYIQGRAGYGATTEGMWPYSYAACDLGTFPNQIGKDGVPAAATTGSRSGTAISSLPGQRLSACTCPGSDHPGPNVATGRGVPEVDILEAQVDTSVFRGQVSQSYQTAPYNYQYNFVNTTPDTTIYDSSITSFNIYKGGPFQQAISAVTYVDSQVYDDQAYSAYGFELWSNPSNRGEGYITWFSNSSHTWTVTPGTIGPDSITQISQRLIPEEPMVSCTTLQSRRSSCSITRCTSVHDTQSRPCTYVTRGPGACSIPDFISSIVPASGLQASCIPK
jgi:beta-glucanase (GH16 family)